MKREILVDVRRHRAGYWSANLKELDGSTAHGRSLSEVRSQMQRALGQAGGNPTHLRIVEVLHLTPEVERAVADIRRRRAELESQSLAVHQELGRVVRKLAGQLRLGVRDTGELLGISAPYVHELRRAPRGRPPVKRKRSSKARAEIRFDRPSTA